MKKCARITSANKENLVKKKINFKPLKIQVLPHWGSLFSETKADTRPQPTAYLGLMPNMIFKFHVDSM